MSNRKYEYKWKVVKVKGFQEPTTKVQSSQDAYEYAKPKFLELDTFREHFMIIALDRANNTIGNKIISSGGRSGTVVDVMIIAKYLTEMMAHGLIMVHNHPSGNIKPSINDDKITLQVRDAIKLLDCLLLDHLILGDGYYSYADEGKL